MKVISWPVGWLICLAGAWYDLRLLTDMFIVFHEALLLVIIYLFYLAITASKVTLCIYEL